MRIVSTALLALALLSGCASMTQGEKQTAGIIGGIAAAAVLISVFQDDDDDSVATGNDCYSVVGGDGRGGTTSQQICR